MTPEEIEAEVKRRIAKREAWAAEHEAELAARAAAKAVEREVGKEAWRAAHEHELEITREIRRREREEERAKLVARTQDPRHDRHTLDMAASMGITPDEFLEWQRKRREEIAAIPSFEEQMRTVKVR